MTLAGVSAARTGVAVDRSGDVDQLRVHTERQPHFGHSFIHPAQPGEQAIEVADEHGLARLQGGGLLGIEQLVAVVIPLSADQGEEIGRLGVQAARSPRVVERGGLKKRIRADLAFVFPIAGQRRTAGDGAVEIRGFGDGRPFKETRLGLASSVTAKRREDNAPHSWGLTRSDARSWKKPLWTVSLA
jgi:hypothetical protein